MFAGGVGYAGGPVFPPGSGFGFGGGMFGAPIAPLASHFPIYKPPPIKYTSVSFPYSSKASH